MSRSAAREQGEIAAVAHRDCATLPAREAAALARRIPFGSGIGAGVGQDEGRGEVARGYVFIERVEQAQPLHQPPALGGRSEEHTSELKSLMRISHAVFCLHKQKNT